MELDEKNILIINKIENLEIHINNLEQGIKEVPDEVISDKPPRSLVLQNLKIQKDILLAELTVLNT